MDRNRGPVRSLGSELRKSFTEVVHQERTIKGKPSQRAAGLKRMKISDKQLDVEWLEGAYVGKVHDVEGIPTLQKRLEDSGFPQCRVRYIGGDTVLISAQNTNLLHSAVSDGEQIWEAGKSLGAAYVGDETEVLYRIREMELRDMQVWNKSKHGKHLAQVQVQPSGSNPL
ncbi:hypothetical protein Ancab_006571 [Ancistrocladus abbreviatus]